MSDTLTGKSPRGWAYRALGVAVVALATLFVYPGHYYLDHHRTRVSSGPTPTPVLVANRLIPKGTLGSVVVTQSLYATTTLPGRDVEVGAISDPAELSGSVSVQDIFPGDQLNATDFARATPTP